MISFGWSVGDVVSVCVILTHVIKAFDNAKGTQKHYRDSHAFLCGLFLVVSYVSDDEKAASLPEDAKTQIQSISNAYSDLHAYILKFAKIDKPDKTRLQSVLPTIKWTMNELNDKVQKMKTNSLSAISIMETLIVMNLSSRVNTLLSMGDRQEESLKTTTDILTDVREQLSNLSQASEDYQQLINDASQPGVDSDAERQDLQNRLDAVSKSQNELQQKLDKLVEHAEEKSRSDQHQAEAWGKLLAEHQQAKESENEDASQGAQQELQRVNGLIGGMGAVTGNSQLTGAATKLGGVSSIFGALGPSAGKVKKPNLSFSGGASSTDYRTRYDCLPAHVRARREYQQRRKNATGPPSRIIRAPPPPAYQDSSHIGPPLPPRPTVTASSSTLPPLRPAFQTENAAVIPRPPLRSAVTAPANLPHRNALPLPSTLQASPPAASLPHSSTTMNTRLSISSTSPPPLPPRQLSTAGSMTSDTSSTYSFELQPKTPQSTFSRSSTLFASPTTSGTSTPTKATIIPPTQRTPGRSLLSDLSSSPSFRPAKPPKPARLSSSTPTKPPYLLELTKTMNAKRSGDTQTPPSTCVQAAAR